MINTKKRKNNCKYFLHSNNIKNILVVRPCAIGDFVQTLPAIRSLRYRFPHAYIEILGNLSTIILAKNRFYANKIDRFDRQDISFLFSKENHIPESIEDYIRNFDLIISYLNDDDKVFMKNIIKIGVKNIINHNPLPIINRSGKQPNQLIKLDKKKHIIDHLLEPIILLGIERSDLFRIAEIYLTENQKAFASDFINSIGKNNNKEKVVAIHPGSGSKKKNWSARRYSEVAKYLTSCGIKLLIISGPADETVISYISKDINMESVVVLKNMKLPAIAAILKRVDFYLGNDSGISHIAAAVNTPSLLMFGPTDPDVWAPKGKNTMVIRAGSACSPCHVDKMRNCYDQKCLKDVSVENVINQINFNLFK